ncbi:MAG: hypothetical protein ACEPOW_13535 [Bacteroidales bacterium]
MKKNINIVFLLLLFSNTLLADYKKDTIDLSRFNLIENPDLLSKKVLDVFDQEINKDVQKSNQLITKVFEVEDQLNDTSLIRFYGSVGRLFFEQGAFHLAYDFFHKQLSLQNQIDSLNTEYIYLCIGNVFCRLENYSKARYFYEKSISVLQKHHKAVNIESYLGYNNLAVIERNEKNLKNSKELLNVYLKEAERVKDTGAIITAYHNLSNTLLDLNEKEKSLSYLNKAIFLSKKSGCDRDLLVLYINKASLYHKTFMNSDTSLYYSNLAYSKSKELGYSFFQKKAIQWMVYEYEKLDNYKKANHFLHEYIQLSEETLGEQIQTELTRVELQYEYEKKEQTLLYNQKRKEMFYLAGSIVLLLVISFLFVLFRFQQQKTKRKNAENEKLEGLLSAKTKELTSNAMHKLQITEIINDTVKELERIQEEEEIQIKKELYRLISNLKKEGQGVNWHEFEKLFVETHKDFYKKLLKEHPNLTQNEIKLCAFLKMNLTTKDISGITKQSYNSITVARTRLRKKLNLSNDPQSLISFLAKY